MAKDYEAQAAKAAALIEQLKQLQAEGDKTAEVEERRLVNVKRLIEAQQSAIDAGKALTKEQAAYIQSLTKVEGLLDENGKVTENLVAQEVALEKALKDTTEAIEDHAEQTDYANKGLFAFLGFTEDAVKEQKKVQNSLKATVAGFKALGTAAGRAKMAQMALAGLAQKAVEILVQQAKQLVAYGLKSDATHKEILKLAGGQDYLKDSMYTNIEALNEYGASHDEVADATRALHGSVTTLNIATKEETDAMIEQVAIAGELGVAYEDSAQAIQNMQRIQGMSTQEAVKASEEMLKFGRAIGDPKKVMADFVKLEPQLAVFGNRANTVFKDLEMRSRASGMEVDKILGMTKQFDTFEGAAESTGKLNAMLGGDFISAMDMMEATNPAERFDMMRNSLDQAGMSYDSMAYYQRQAIAESMGLSDVSDLALMMNGNYEDMAGGVAQSTEEIVAQKEEAKKMKTVQDAAILSQEKANQAVITAMSGAENFGEAMDNIQPVIEEMNDGLDKLAGAADILMFVLIGIQGLQLAATLGPMAAKFFATGTAGTAAGVGTGAAAVGMEASNRSSWKLVAGIAAVVIIFGLLYWVLFVKKSSPPLYIGLFIVAAGIYAISKMSKKSVKNVTKLVPAMLAMALVVLSVGIAVYIAAAGVALMAEAFAQLSPGQIIGVVIALAVMGVILIALISTIGGLGPIGWIAVAVMLAAAAAMYIAAYAVKILAEGLAILLKAIEPIVEIVADTLLGLFDRVIQVAGIMSETFIELASIISDTVLGIIDALVAGITAVGEVITDVMETLPDLVSSLAELGFAGPGLILAGAGLASVALGLGSIGLAVAVIKTDDLEALGDMLLGLGKMSEGNLPNFTSAVKELASLADDYDGEIELDVDIDINTAAAELLIKMIKTIKSLEEETVSNLADGIKQIARAVEEIPEEKIIRFQKVLDDAVMLSEPLSSTSGLTGLIDGIFGATGGAGAPGMGAAMAGATGGKPININVTVELDKKVLGKVVKTVMAKSLG